MASAQPLDFTDLMPRVALHLLGEPNPRLSRGDEMRWGTHGSLSVDKAKGTYFDHEIKVGGGAIDLIMRERGCDLAGAMAWLESEGLKEPSAEQAPASAKPNSTFYDYYGADGAAAYRVERRERGLVKTFLQHGPDGRGGFHCVKGCMDGVERLPYRLPQLIEAPLDRLVYIVEGEKDADRLAQAGLIVTTNSGGAGNFKAELAKYFTGRRVIIIADNDKPGRDHAADVEKKLKSQAAEVAILSLPGPEKGDVSDWLALGGSAFELGRLATAALEKPAKLLPLIDPAAWQGLDAPSREWALSEWIPARQATYLTGPGSAGKSLLTQMLCTCIALGRPFMGIETRQAVAIYVTCEDDADELHRRQKAICEALGVPLSALAGKLHLVSLAGAIGNELATFTPEGRMTVAENYHVLRATALATGAGFIALDNVAHLFAGNENIRNQVAAFVGLLNQLAHDTRGSVLFLGHPNKAGDAFSGSTAWENQVRSRLFLETPKEADGSVSDPDQRALSRGKANYARNGEAIIFRWHRWAFVRDEDLPTNIGAEIAANAQATWDNEIFLSCLRQRNKEGRHVSERTGANFAPAIFADMPEAKKIGKARLRAALDRLFRIGAIERAVLGRDTDKGRDIVGLREVPNHPQTPTPNAPQTVPQATPKRAPDEPQTTPHTHAYINISGAAPKGTAAPYPDDDDFDPFDHAPMSGGRA